MRDFIGDMLTRIRNGQRARLESIILHPATPNYCENLLELLWEEGYIRGFTEFYDEKKNRKFIKVLLKYNSIGTPIIKGVFRVSTPGRRRYISIKALWKPKSTGGIFVLSTPRGVMVDRDARLLNVGGEVLFGIY